MQEPSSENGANRVWMVAFLACLGFLAATRLPSFTKSSGVTPIEQRRAMGALELPQHGGGKWRLADHRGKVVLINYWATWCGPCVEELPALIQTAHDSGPKGLDVIGISIDAGPDASAKVKQFVTRYRVPYPMAFASAMWSGAAGVTGPPVTLLLDRQGRIAKTYIGEVESKQLAANVRTLLAET